MPKLNPASMTFWRAIAAIVYCCIAFSSTSYAQTWTEAHFRGAPNNWAATAMTKNTTTGLWEIRQSFSAADPGFKISHYANNWDEAYPEQDWVVTTGAGDYQITFDDATKAINVNKLVASSSSVASISSSANNSAVINSSVAANSSASSINGSAVSSSRSSTNPNTHVANVTNAAGTVNSRLPCYPAQQNSECDLRIYQVMVESFIDGDASANFNTGFGTSHHKGDLQGIINSLDYIQSLGVNALWLTPIFHSVAIAGQDDSANRLDATGYYASNYFAIDPRFGSEAQLHQLVELAHEKGLYVFLDGVFGHFKSNASNYPSPNGLRVSTRGAGQGATGRVAVYPDDLEFFKEVATYWVNKFKIDGWRLDQAYQVPANYWDDIRSAVEQASAGITYANARGQDVKPLGHMVAEVWKGEGDIASQAYGPQNSVALKSAFDFPLRYKLLQTLAVEESGLGNSPAATLNTGFATHQAYPDHAMPNLMLGNHDLVRFGDLLQRGGIANPADASYWQRHKAAFSFMAAFSGPVTVYYGDEVGQELPGFAAAVNPCNGSSGLCDDHVARTSGIVEGIATTQGGSVTILTSAQRDLKNYVADLMNLRAEHPALARGTRTHIFSNTNVYIDRKENGNSRILYLLNTKGVPAVINISAAAIGATNALVDLQNPLRGYENIAGIYRVELEPFEALFLYMDGNNSSSSSASNLSSSSSSAGMNISSNNICYNNATNHAAPYIYFWNPTPAGSVSPLPAWPGSAMVRRGNFYCYDFTASLGSGSMPTSLAIIFSNNGAAQTADLSYTGAGCYENGVWKTLQQCGFTFAGNSSSSSSSAISSSSSSAIAQQTRIYFKNTLNYATPYIHYFDVLPARAATTWPGIAMKNLGDGWYSFDFDSAVNTAGIVFNNNGAPQTDNLTFSASLNCYSNGSWQTAEICDAPSELVANAGVDRKVNVNTRQALSAAASIGNYVTATWTSPAWTGALTGKQVVTPILTAIGNHTVTLTVTGSDNRTATDTMVVNVVAAAQGLPERPQLAAPLGFPITGNVGVGNYRFVDAYPNLERLFHSPVMVTNDGLNDLVYVVDKVGAIFVFPNEESVTQAEVREILDLRSTVLNNHESGMLSMAFDPNYAANGFIYVYYIYGTTDQFLDSNGEYGYAVLERWTVNDPGNPTGVVVNSKAELLRIPQPGPDHKGGMMRFHPTENYLYLGIGDGAYGHSAMPLSPPLTGPEGRTNNSAQQTDNLRGKIIRIKPLATPVNGKYYEVPADNPFVGMSGYLPEIWSLGHRNPWRWAFDSAAPYTLWETEVGQAGFEEVNLIQKGKNYGWPVCEGTVNRGTLGGNPAKSCMTDYVPPRDGYDHAAGQSIIGGIVYRGAALPNLTGSFIFGDYVSKRIWSIANDGKPKKIISEAFPFYISSFGSDLNQNLLISTHGVEHGGPSSIYKMVDDDAAAAQIPAKLSATGLFADLAVLVPAHGVIEYAVNSKGWFDGANARHFIAVPNEATLDFDVTAIWNSPVGTVLVKHLSVAATGNPAKPFTTSVLFRQEAGWQAANYRWNAAGTDADLVTESVTVADGSLANIQRKVYSGAGCVVCHKGADGKMNPLAVDTRQLNRDFNYQQGLSKNQLEVFNSINLFTTGINHASSYDQFAAPADTTASLTARARSYLHTNCAHCHSSSFMDMRYDTPLDSMHLVNEGGTTKRIKPGDPANSLLYVYQTTDGNRMPNGTVTTNPAAATLFASWIDGLGQELVQTGVNLRSNKISLAVNGTVTLTLEAVFDSGVTGAISDPVAWTSSNPTVLNVSDATGATVTAAAGAVGSVTITAMADGYSDTIQLTVTKASSSSSSSSSAAPITAVEITPGSVTLADRQQLVAYGVRSDGTRANLYGQISWRIASGTTVASVSANGLLTRLTSGEAAVEASYQGMAATLAIGSSAPGLHLRFDNSGNWASVRVHLWTVVNGVTKDLAPWPGTPMVGPDADGWWTFVVQPQHLNNGSINVIFNNGNGTQTADLLNINQSSSYNFTTRAWTPWNPGGPNDGTLYRLSVIGGTTPDNARDFAAGSVVAVTANNPPFGTTFSGWTDDALPYVFTDPTKPVVQLVIPTHGLALQAVFKGDAHGPARDLFAGQCTSCHGVKGVGGLAAALNGLHESSAWTVDILAAYINDYMPMGASAQCTGTSPGGCAYDIASMIMANAWDAPVTCEGSGCTAGTSLDSRNLRLLTREEYLNSVSDILGINFASTLLSPVPVDGTVRNYDTASSLTLNDDRTLGYRMVAEDIANRTIVAKGFLGLASGCSNNTCVVTNLGKKLFRRPLTSAEITRYVNLYSNTDAGRGVLQALLISPKFLYRSEMGVLDSATDLYRLTNYEIATLLSYAFWVTAPDDALLSAAAAASFDIEAQVNRLLNDPRAERGLRRFARGWMINNKYGFNSVSDPTLIESFKEETIRLVMESIKDNVPVNTILTANYTYANQQLAQYYGLASVPPANTWQKVSYAAGDLRADAGVLGHGSFLASRASSKPAPIQRGVFVREVLMCQEFPPPAAANFDVKFANTDTNRDATSRHTSDPGCAVCHQFIDGVGFGFERLGSDALLRATEVLGNGTVVNVDASGYIKSLSAPETTLDPDSPDIAYNSVPELASLIANSGQSEACYSRQFYRYLVGRSEAETDESIIRAYSADVRNGGGMRDMLIDLTLNNSFILRR